jgi:hypothetical protein
MNDSVKVTVVAPAEGIVGAPKTSAAPSAIGAISFFADILWDSYAVSMLMEDFSFSDVILTLSKNHTSR